LHCAGIEERDAIVRPHVAAGEQQFDSRRGNSFAFPPCA
jgi:hypothetical protein